MLQLAREHGLVLVPFASADGSPLVSAHGLTVRSPDELGALGARLGVRTDEAGLSQGALLGRYTADIPDDLAETTPAVDSYVRWQRLRSPDLAGMASRRVGRRLARSH